MQTKSITIINKLGLHARAAARLVQLASRFDCDINIILNGRKVNGKSIMGIMMLAASKDTTVQITTAGPDELVAMSGLEELIQARFGEDE
ncbi:MAG: phosphotransferase system, HPR-related protein [Gammaproteobacteria bacterium]|nr:phosphotransferase system, HPR-related protein [Gammaproteobacteria bacterium]